MGHKKVCLNCNISSNRKFDSGSDLQYPCSECGKSMLLLPHRFRPPKKEDNKGWEVVKYLVENGFTYQHIYKNVELKNGVISFSNYAEYPTNMRDAKEFVEKYREQIPK